MWIKRTRSGGATYLQLMKTEYLNGKPRQKMIYSLGKEGDVDMEKARALAHAISNDAYDFVDSEALSLLPTKKYGEALVLMKLFEITSMRRFISDAARAMGLEEADVDALFALTAYYFLKLPHYQNFARWKEDYYLPNAWNVTEATLQRALQLMAQVHVFNPGLKTIWARARAAETPVFVYGFAGRYDFLPEDTAYTFFWVGRQDVPLNYQVTTKKRMVDCLWKTDILIGDFDVLQPFSAKEKQPYVLKVSPADLQKTFAQPKAAAAFYKGNGTYLPFREYGYREGVFEGKRVILLRLGAGEAPELDAWHREPRDVIVTNTELPVETLLQKYLAAETLQDIIYMVDFPEDLSFLKRQNPTEDLMQFIGHIQFLELFLYRFLEKKMAHHDLSVEDALAVLGEIRIANITYGNNSKLLHSAYSTRQQDILNMIAFDDWVFPQPESE